jgi:hypothetical protein
MPYQMPGKDVSPQWHAMPPLSSSYIAIKKSNTLRKKKRNGRRRKEMQVSTCLVVFSSRKIPQETRLDWWILVISFDTTLELI